MNSTSSINFPSPELFSAICGANDQNLNFIEQLLGAELYPVDTRVSIKSTNADTVKLFTSLMNELIQHQQNGQYIKRQVIESVFSSISDNPARIGELGDKSIDIPRGYSRVFPRSYNQARFLDALNQQDLVFGIGPAGTGKTFLAVAHALSAILHHKTHKLILTRPVVEAGENLGFLPGDLSQKLNPYLKPLYDAMNSLVPGDIINKLENNRSIEIAPLAYMRGRSLKDSCIILDEAQNTTKEQMKMFLTRLGEGSQAVITGDITQIDLPRHNTSGLIHATKILKDVEGIHFNFFATKDVVRSKLVKQIIAAYEKDN